MKPRASQFSGCWFYIGSRYFLFCDFFYTIASKEQANLFPTLHLLTPIFLFSCPVYKTSIQYGFCNFSDFPQIDFLKGYAAIRCERCVEKLRVDQVGISSEPFYQKISWTDKKKLPDFW